MGAIGEWQRGPVIGRGALATVSIAADRRTGLVFAVKTVEAALAGVLKREQSVLDVLAPSPYVVSCLGSTVSADGCGGKRFDLFLEYAPGGSIADEIGRRGGRCEEAVIRARAADVLRGLAHVHAAGFAHCDVKGRNVLLRADGRAMLADFGCARRTADDNGGGAGAVGGGTPAFMAPEAARGEAQGAAADVWALGYTVVEMATGAAPWRLADPVAALHHVARSGEVPDPPAWLTDEGKDFLARCLVRDPSKRWTAERLLQHPFVSAAIDPSAAKGEEAIEPRVSPKSIFDQGFWEESESDSLATDATAAALTAPADRVRALAGGVPPDWSWTSGEEHWITVFTADVASPRESDASASSKFEVDSAGAESFEAEVEISPTGPSEDPHIGSGEQHMALAASPSRDRGGAGSSTISVARDNCVTSVSGSDNDCCSSGNSASERSNEHDNGVINLQTPNRWLVNSNSPPDPSWQPFFHFPGIHALFLTFPSRARRNLAVVVVVTSVPGAAYDSSPHGIGT
jgi:mitogen-activated protein kinase kinase kinase 17/18